MRMLSLRILLPQHIWSRAPPAAGTLEGGTGLASLHASGQQHGTTGMLGECSIDSYGLEKLRHREF